MFLRAAMSAACLLVADAAIAQAGADTPGQGRSRLFVLTDIENEPDDTQSLIRLLLYSNEIDIEGLVATTSVHKRTSVAPEAIRHIIERYGAVLPSLRLHDAGYPDADALAALVIFAD